MFFLASKIFWFVASPLHLCLLGLVAGLLCLNRFSFGLPLAATAAAALAVMTFTPLGALLLRQLENRFPFPQDVCQPKGVIVLGGSVDERISRARGQIAFNDAAERLTEAAILARRYPQARLVFSGGSAALVDDSVKEAESARQFWLDLGLPEDRMSFEAASRNTFENALFTRRLVDPRPDECWLLVTSAYHMPRAMGIFRALGMNPTAYPVDYRTYGGREDLRPPLDGSQAIRNVEIALREWTGLAAYRLSGKTEAFFPAP